MVQQGSKKSSVSRIETPSNQNKGRILRHAFYGSAFLQRIQLCAMKQFLSEAGISFPDNSIRNDGTATMTTNVDEGLVNEVDP